MCVPQMPGQKQAKAKVPPSPKEGFPGQSGRSTDLKPSGFWSIPAFPPSHFESAGTFILHVEEERELEIMSALILLRECSEPRAPARLTHLLLALSTPCHTWFPGLLLRP